MRILSHMLKFNTQNLEAEVILKPFTVKNYKKIYY